MPCLLVLLAILAWAAGGRADAADPYAQLVQDAIEAQELGNFVRARALLQAAHRLEPSARTLRGMGVVAYQAGEFPQAAVDLSASLDEKHKPLDEELRVAVRALLELVYGKVGRYRVVTDPVETALRVDEHPPLFDAQGELVLAPGWHTIVFSATGHERRELSLEVPAGAHGELRASLPLAQTSLSEILAGPVAVDRFQLDESAIRRPAQSTLAPTRTAASATPSRRAVRVRAALWVTLAAGSALAVNTAVLAGIGWKRKRAIERDCGEVCDPSYLTERVERAHLAEFERAINVTGSLALGSLATALGLWIWERADAAETKVSVAGRTASMALRF